jgi:hypothetical protein
MVKFYIAYIQLMNPHRRINDNNKKDRTEAIAAIPMVGAIVTAALLLSGLALIGSYQQPVIAQQQNMTGGNATMAGGGNATNATMAGGGNATNATMAGGGNATNMTTGGTEGGGGPGGGGGGPGAGGPEGGGGGGPLSGLFGGNQQGGNQSGGGGPLEGIFGGGQ